MPNLALLILGVTFFTQLVSWIGKSVLQELVSRFKLTRLLEHEHFWTQICPPPSHLELCMVIV